MIDDGDDDADDDDGDDENGLVVVRTDVYFLWRADTTNQMWKVQPIKAMGWFLVYSDHV